MQNPNDLVSLALFANTMRTKNPFEFYMPAKTGMGGGAGASPFDPYGIGYGNLGGSGDGPGGSTWGGESLWGGPSAVDLGWVTDEQATAIAKSVMNVVSKVNPIIALPYALASKAGAFPGLTTGMQGGIPAAQAAAHAHALTEMAAQNAYGGSFGGSTGNIGSGSTPYGGYGGYEGAMFGGGDSGGGGDSYGGIGFGGGDSYGGPGW